MSWNGYPISMRNFLIRKLKTKYENSTSNSNADSQTDENIAKNWMKIPYFGNRGEDIIKSCTLKIKRFLTKPVKFIIIYDIKRISFFVSNKDKLPPLSRSNLVDEVSCPGCGKSYIGMTKRCLSVRLKEHATQVNSGAIGKHFSDCECAQYLANLQNQFCLLNDIPLPSCKYSSTILDSLSLLVTLCSCSTVLLCIYTVCKVLCFILSDDDFEIKSKIWSLNCLSCLFMF